MILVTGATGTVGSELVKQLKTAGAKFRVAVSSVTKAKKANAEGLEAAVLDYTDTNTFHYALQGVHKLFLLSPPGSTHVEEPVIEAAKKSNVKHIVKLSAIAADSGATVFGREHGLMEKAILKAGIPYTFLRPNGFMQNYMNNFGASIKQQGNFFLAQGDSKYSVVDVKDIAAVAVKALTEPGHENKSYSITGPEALSNGQIAEKLSKVAGKKVTYVALTDDQMRSGMTQQGAPPVVIDALIDLMHFYVSGKAAGVSPDVKRVTGREATTFDQFAQENAAAFRA